ncbi:MAG: DUF4395 domain-containing protein [Bacteroidales bacterium]|nr:DUF4395 domain-containing protein [Bacteroidales bacterium]MCF8391043.1 DUF4395 domain-containing protein [Bacteroidales bacterium]
MKTYAVCPISDNTINERVARLNAIFGVILLFGFVFTQNIFFVIFLSFDFLLRSTEYSKYSLIGVSSKNIMSYLDVKPKSINAGPKIFAARIGFVLTALVILSFLLSLNGVSLILVAILGVFSFLEGALGFCVACQIYPYLYKYLYGEE